MSLSIMGGIALGTLVSEDLAAVGAGLLAATGQLTLLEAIAASVAGTYLGDVGLWALGRSGRCLARRLPSLGRRLDRASRSGIGVQLDTHLGATVLVSRFLPGTRLLTYLAAGIWGRRAAAFACWAFLAVLLWTPLLVVAARSVGDAVLVPILRAVELGAIGALAVLVAVWCVARIGSHRLALAVRRYHQRRDQTIETPTWWSTAGTFHRRMAECASRTVSSGFTR